MIFYKSFYISFVGMLLILLMTYMSFAQEIDTQVNLPQVIISGVRGSESTDSLPSRISVLNKIQIESYPFVSADEFLNLIPGVDDSRFFGIFNKSGDISIRGLNRNVHNLVMIDGLPFSLINGGSSSWNRIDPAMIDKIIVLKGPSSYLYGNNAMGGVINILTKKPDKLFSLNARSFYGTYNTAGGSLNLYGRLKKQHGLYWRLSNYYRKSDGYILQSEATRTVYDNKAKLQEFYSSGALGYMFNKDNVIESELNYGYDNRSTGYKVYEPEGCYNKYNTGYFKTRYNGNILDTKIELNFFAKLEEYEKQNEGVKKKTGKYAFDNTENTTYDAGFLMNMSHNIYKDNILTLGTDVKSSSVVSNDIFRTSTDTISYTGKMNFYGIFLQDEQRLIAHKLKLVVALRYDNISFYNGKFKIYSPSIANEFLKPYNKDFERINWVNISPKIGLLYYLNSYLNGFVSFSRGFRPAVVNDLCRVGDVDKGFKLPNPLLKPETMDNLELGLNFTYKELRINPTLYYSIGSGFQYFVSTGDSIYTTGDNAKPVIIRENIKQVNIYGSEIDITYKLIEPLNFIFNWTFNISKINKSDNALTAGQDLNGKILNDVARNIIFAGAFLDYKFISYTLVFKYRSPKWIDDDNTLLSNDYVDFDTKLLFHLNKYLSASITIQNLLNRNYIDNKGQITPGRFITTELNIKI